MKTFAPRAPSLRAPPAPTPRLPPVTRATRPLISISALLRKPFESPFQACGIFHVGNLQVAVVPFEEAGQHAPGPNLHDPINLLAGDNGHALKPTNRGANLGLKSIARLRAGSDRPGAHVCHNRKRQLPKL